MTDSSYNFMRTNGNGKAATAANQLYTSCLNRTTTSMQLSLDSSISPVTWYICGF